MLSLQRSGGPRAQALKSTDARSDAGLGHPVGPVTQEFEREPRNDEAPVSVSADRGFVPDVQHGVEYANLLPSLTRARRAMETTFDLPERGERHVRERQKVSRQVPQETIDTLVSRYLDGVLTLTLAKQFKLGNETVSKLLRGAGVETRRQGLPEDKVAEAGLYGSGLTLAQVAERYAVSVHAVYNKLRAAGVRMRDSHDRKRPQR